MMEIQTSPFPIKVKEKSRYGLICCFCPTCGGNIIRLTSERFCQYCGQRVSWEGVKKNEPKEAIQE